MNCTPGGASRALPASSRPFRCAICSRTTRAQPPSGCTRTECCSTFSRQRVDLEVLAQLQSLAEERDWQRRVRQLVDGAAVNTTEDTPALHTALRSPPGEMPGAARDVPDTLARIRRFSDAVTTGSWRGFSGRAITDVVNIGIGGSDLGPRLVVEALQPAGGRPGMHFVHNIDGHAIATVLARLNPETSLFMLASKSFTTRETLVNGETARSWFMERTNRADSLARHFIAVTANPEAAGAFGLPPENLFPMWDWVGGRYSLWSAVGLPIVLALGTTAFDELLRGAHAMDRHFRSAPAAANAPLLAALLGIWNTNFLGAASHAVLAYDERLRLLPEYLQQLETESNGKRVRHDGSAWWACTRQPVLWGGTRHYGTARISSIAAPGDAVVHRGLHSLRIHRTRTRKPSPVASRQRTRPGKGHGARQRRRRPAPGGARQPCHDHHRARPAHSRRHRCIARLLRAQGVLPRPDLGHKLVRSVGRGTGQGIRDSRFRTTRRRVHGRAGRYPPGR